MVMTWMSRMIMFCNQLKVHLLKLKLPQLGKVWPLFSSVKVVVRKYPWQV